MTRLLVALVCGGLALAATEGVLRATEGTRLNTRANVLNIWAPSTDARPFALRPGAAVTVTTPEFTFAIAITADGLRGPDVESPTLVMGDSFAFGYGVQGGERFSDRLGARSVGYADGFSPVDYAAALPVFYARYRPSRVIVSVFPENDLIPDVQARTLLRDADGDIVASRMHGLSVVNGYLVSDAASAFIDLKQALWNTFAVYRVAERARTVLLTEPARYPTMADAAVTLDALAQMDRFCRARGVPLVVVLVPSNIQAADRYAQSQLGQALLSEDRAQARQSGEPHASLTRWLVERGIHAINPMAAFQEAERQGTALYFAFDGHLTPAGHAVLADVIRADLLTGGESEPW